MAAAQFQSTRRPAAHTEGAICKLAAAVQLVTAHDTKAVRVQFHAGDIVGYVKAVLHQQRPELPMTMVRAEQASVISCKQAG